jgi:hypothetical protein
LPGRGAAKTHPAGRVNPALRHGQGHDPAPVDVVAGATQEWLLKLRLECDRHVQPAGLFEASVEASAHINGGIFTLHKGVRWKEGFS